MWILLTLCVLLVALRLAIPSLSSSVAKGPIERDGERVLADCPDTPNCQGSSSTRQDQRVDAFAMRGTADETLQSLEQLLAGEPRAAIVKRDANYLHATFTTRLMGYIDDVEFLVDEASSTVHVRSASRLGKSDLGANAKRLAALRVRWSTLGGG